jgi:threonylcarbamoyladenosine tRNA methylthiotransferase MtaB
MDCTDEIVRVVASSPRLAHHFHLPLQNGSDDVLAMMQRPYTVSYYCRLVESITALMPHAAVGSDIIVGFPGETPFHFDETLAALQRIPLTYLHVFPYSDRPGTAASRRRPKVDGAEIRDRARQVRDVGERMTRRFRLSQVGRVMRALSVDDGQAAVTDNYLKLRLDVKRARNQWVDVRVDSEHAGHVVEVSGGG